MRKLIVLIVILVAIPTQNAFAEIAKISDSRLQKGLAMVPFLALSVPIVFGKSSEIGLAIGAGVSVKDEASLTVNLHGHSAARWGKLGYDLLLIEHSRGPDYDHHGRFHIIPMLSFTLAGDETWELRGMAGPHFGYEGGISFEKIYGLAVGPRLRGTFTDIVLTFDLLYKPMMFLENLEHTSDGIARIATNTSSIVQVYAEGRLSFGPELSPPYLDVSREFLAALALGISFTW